MSRNDIEIANSLPWARTLPKRHRAGYPHACGVEHLAHATIAWAMGLKFDPFPTAFALILAATSPARAEPEGYTLGTAPEVAEFGDWSVACDNAKRCEAIGVSVQRARSGDTEWGEKGVLVLRVTREAGPDTHPRVFVDKRLWGGLALDRHRALTLHVLYPDEPDRIGPAYRLLPLSGGQYEVDPRQVDTFLAETAKTRAAVTRMGAINSLGSTQGMIAALRYIDEAQDRRENVTAIFGKGAEPASLVAKARLLPQVRVIKGAANTAGIKVQDDELRKNGLLICGVTAAPHTGMRYALANGETLWRVDCGGENSPDSDLNPRSAWFHYRAGRGRILPRFPRPEQGRAPLPNDLPNSSFDPKTGLITATLYYGKNRDCGWRRQWGWNGKEWQLVTSRELHGCMGIMPEGWLPIWRSRVR